MEADLRGTATPRFRSRRFSYVGKQRHKKDGQDVNKSNQALGHYQKTGEEPGEGRHESDAEKVAKLDRADFDKDLRPHENQGQNLPQNAAVQNTRSAYDLKKLHEKFPQLSSADLKQLAILPWGAKLEQGASYLDLNRLEDGEFKARADFDITETNLLVAKNSVDYELWDRLRGHGERVASKSAGTMSGGDASTDEAPKGEAPKGEAPKGEAPKGEAPKGEAPNDSTSVDETAVSA